VRWNLWILDVIRNEVATVAAARELSPSQLVQEVLWQMLAQPRVSKEPPLGDVVSGERRRQLPPNR
jgi:hypothetical protein